MVWPTVGSRTAKDQIRSELCNKYQNVGQQLTGSGPALDAGMKMREVTADNMKCEQAKLPIT